MGRWGYRLSMVLLVSVLSEAKRKAHPFFMLPSINYTCSKSHMLNCLMLTYVAYPSKRGNSPAESDITTSPDTLNLGQKALFYHHL